MQIIDYIPVGHTHAVSRKWLAAITGIPDRQVRDMIHEAKRDTVILNLGDGYYRPDISDPVDVYELHKYVNQETARIKSTGWALKAARQMVRQIGET
ncbi:MAG: hypothetical protein ACI4ET_07225 [Bilifractor sp.]